MPESGVSCPSACGTSSPTRDRSHVPCTGKQVFIHWPTRGVPHSNYFLNVQFSGLKYIPMLCTPYHQHLQHFFTFPNWNLYPLNTHFLFPYPQPLTTTILLPVSVNLAALGTLYKWSHTCPLWWMSIIYTKKRKSVVNTCVVLKGDKCVTQNMPFGIRIILSFQHLKNSKYRKVILISTFLLKTGDKNCQVKDALLVP